MSTVKARSRLLVGFGFATSASLLLILFTGCASGKSAAQPVPAVPQADSACAYLNVFVALDAPVHTGDAEAELVRRAILLESAEVLSRLGLRMVRDGSEAYWRLYAEGWRDSHRNFLVHVVMQGEPKLVRHMFVVLTAGEELPYRGGIGSSQNFAIKAGTDARSLKPMVENAMRWIWERESEQILALCEIRSRLIEEGWTEIDELRDELVKEIRHVRGERARAQREKNLRLEIEDQP